MRMTVIVVTVVLMTGRTVHVAVCATVLMTVAEQTGVSRPPSPRSGEQQAAAEDRDHQAADDAEQPSTDSPANDVDSGSASPSSSTPPVWVAVTVAPTSTASFTEP